MRSRVSVAGAVSFAAWFALPLIGSEALVRASAAVSPVKAGRPCKAALVGQRNGSLVCQKVGRSTKWTPAAPPSTAAPSPAGGVAIVSGAGRKDDIPVGVALDLTGSSKLVGNEELAAARAAESWVNDNGGVQGRRIRLVVADTGSSDAGAVAAVTRLIRDESVVAIVGPTLSPQVKAVASVVEQQKVPLIAPSATANGIAQLGRYVLRTSSPRASYAGTALRYVAKKRAISAVALIAAPDAESQAEAALMRKAVRDVNLSLFEAPTLTAGSTDYSAAIRAVIANRPDVVALAVPSSGARLINELKAAGFRGELIGSNALGIGSALGSCGQDCENLWFSFAYAPTTASTVNTAFRTQFLRDQRRDPSQIAAQTFTAVQVVGDALTKLQLAGKLDGPVATVRDGVVEQALAGTYDSPLGTVAFDADGDIKQTVFYVGCTHIVRSGDGYVGEMTYIPA